jgi:hypothetical protein
VLAERWDGHEWSIQPTPDPSQGGGFLVGVACPASSSCTAVGGSNAGTLAERWNGHTWRIQPSPNPSGLQFGYLNGVGCSSRSACTAVGGYVKSSGHRLTLAERFKARKWTIQHTPSPDPAQGDFLEVAACPSSTTCTAFGTSRLSNGSGTPVTLVQRWNGHSWRLQRTPNPGRAGGAQLLGTSCVSQSSCMAVGESTLGTLAARWNGKVWTIEPTPRPAGAVSSGLDGVSCTSRSSCIAVGGADFTAFVVPGGTLAEHWNGRRWSIQPTPTSKSPGVLNAVSCTSASACTAVGGTPSKLLAERWNGTRWKVQHVPVPAGVHGGFLTGVSCTSASSCIAVGIAGFDSSGNPVGTIAERWNGHAWHIQQTPTFTSPGDAFNAVSCTSASACTAVGGTATKLLAERLNGTSWTIQATPTPKSTQQGQGAFFNGVSCPSSSACTAVALGLPSSGPFVLAERWNGTRWSIQPTPNLPAPYDVDNPAVSCPDSTTCTAVGGFTNDGVKLTLAERWNRHRTTNAASSSSPTAGGPSVILGPGPVRARATACSRAGSASPLQESWAATAWLAPIRLC